MTTREQRRAAALKAMSGYDLSQRRARRLIGVDPKTVRRKRPPDHPENRTRMRGIGNRPPEAVLRGGFVVVKL